MSLKVALIGGPMYDRLYGRLNTFSIIHEADVRIDSLGTHPSLNEHLASVADPLYEGLTASAGIAVMLDVEG